MSTATETGTTTPASSSSPGNKVLALALTEARLVFRNRTLLVSAIVLPLAMGAWFAFSFGTMGEPAFLAVVLALQLSVVMGMTVYVAAAQTVVARRHNRVLKRMRTSGISDTGLLVATIAPCVAIGLFQLVLFVPFDAYLGLPVPADPLSLLLAVLGGFALSITAALATTVVTASPERAQITTLPLTFLLLGAATALAVAPTDGWWQALVLIPGAPLGLLAKFAVFGGGWEAGALGLPVMLPALLMMVVWPVVFAVLAKRSFRWDPRT